MTMRRIRATALFFMFAIVAVGTAFNIITADKKTQSTDAIMVIAYYDMQ